MLAHPLTNFEIQKYNQNEPRFNGVYSIDNLPKTKDGAYVMILELIVLLFMLAEPVRRT